MTGIREVVVPQAPVRRHPAPDAPLDTEALMGERVVVREWTDEGWCRGELAGDGYPGWLPASALGLAGPAPTHKVAALRTLAFAGPSIKIPPLAGLSFGCRVAVERTSGMFAVTGSGQFLPAQHLVALAEMESDPVAVAERFIGTPYLWGGKTSLGLDCSGLVQLSLAACGIACPRDSGPQERALGTPVAPGEARRGDLVFWPGHVAMVRDRTSIVHANAHHMAVAIEPMAEAVARIRAAGSEISSVRRLAPRRGG